MAEAFFLIRLDDATPWRDRARWDRTEALLDRHGVKPIVAVVPRCADPEIMPGDLDPAFWPRVRGWQAKGWTLALHGFDHVFTGRHRGLVPLNQHTEFSGQPEGAQRQKIREGWAVLAAEGLAPTVWVAPAHTFDRTTLKLLTEETTIRTISDGLSSRPFARHGFAWFPQQLWRPRNPGPGVWTLCLHPNDHTPEFEASLERFLASPPGRLVALADLPVPTRPWGASDWVFERAFLSLRFLKRMLPR